MQANLQSEVRQQIVSGIQKSDSSFSDDLMGWLFMECPSGLSPSSAVISSWIYGSEGNPASKYIKSMQLMADKSTAIEAGTQKVCTQTWFMHYAHIRIASLTGCTILIVSYCTIMCESSISN